VPRSPGHNHDPYGRLDTVTAGATTVERYDYDGFDRVARHEKTPPGGGPLQSTTYTYDPLDRTTTRVDKAGTPQAKTTTFGTSA